VRAGAHPSSPRRSDKTDKRDALKLARLLAAGDLKLVTVPDPEHEWLRDLVRAREDARVDLMRVRHRVSKFLLRRELHAPARVGNDLIIDTQGGATVRTGPGSDKVIAPGRGDLVVCTAGSHDDLVYADRSDTIAPGCRQGRSRVLYRPAPPWPVKRCRHQRQPLDRAVRRPPATSIARSTASPRASFLTGCQTSTSRPTSAPHITPI
jgi:hypothetical protein